MKLSLLITGQIRNEAEFRILVREIDCIAHRFHKIVFSSWSDQLRLAQATVSDKKTGYHIEFCDCGHLLPLIDTLHGRFKSFLAQHQQLALGLDLFDADSHVLRIRADFKSQVTGHFRQFIDILDAAWRLDESKCLILGAAGFVPCFFEDRILMLTPSAAVKLKNMPMANIYKIDNYNIYPEYLIYSTIMDGYDLVEVFLRHDHRYIGNDCNISEYDRIAFGKNYEIFVEKYIERFEESFVFLGDAAFEVGMHELFSEIELYLGFDSRDKATFKDRWRTKVREFYNCSDRLDRAHPPEKSRGFDGIESEKQTLNMFKNEYVCQRFSNIVEWSGLSKESIFYYEYLEMVGCSLYFLGRADHARPILDEVVASGKAGQECFFYLVMIVASAGDYGRLEQISRLFLERFPNETRVIEHIEGVWKSVDRTPPSDLKFR